MPHADIAFIKSIDQLVNYAILQLLHLTWTKVLVRSFILLEYKQ